MDHEDAALPKTGANLRMEEVLRADEARYEAMVEGDLAVLDRLLSPALTYTHSSAHTENKVEYLASLASGRVRYLATQRDTVSVRMLESAAILEGHVILSAIVDGVTRRLDNKFLSVWTCADHAWQLIAWASTPIPPPSIEGGPHGD